MVNGKFFCVHGGIWDDPTTPIESLNEDIKLRNMSTDFVEVDSENGLFARHWRFD